MEKSKAVVLFTGGADSALAVIRAVEHHDEITLLTFHMWYDLFLSRSRVLAGRLQERFPHCVIRHEIIDNSGLYHRILRRFVLKFRDPSIVLLSERGAMIVRTAAYCLQRGIAQVYDGSNCGQGKIATPQKAEILELVRKFFLDFGIRFDTPIYEGVELSETALVAQGYMREDERYQDKRLFFGTASHLARNIIVGLRNKAVNKLHPVFIVETSLQLFAVLFAIRERSHREWQDIITRSRLYMAEILCFGERYVHKLS